MPYDLSAFQQYLENVDPMRIVLELDHSLYNLVLNADFFQTTEGLADHYHELIVLRNQFAIIANVPHIEPDTGWR